jgi:hypothetical protein
MNIFQKSTAANNKALQAVLAMDYSLLNYKESSQSAARHVNAVLGMRDGGNTNISMGNVLYPSEQDARRARVTSVPETFYPE